MTTLAVVAQQHWATSAPLEMTRSLTDVADAAVVEALEQYLSKHPSPGQFAWVALGSQARREVNLASDQDHLLVWESAENAQSEYAHRLAVHVVAKMSSVGIRPCSGNHMATRLSRSVTEWRESYSSLFEHPSSPSDIDRDLMLDMRVIFGTCPVDPLRATINTAPAYPDFIAALAHRADLSPVALNGFGRLKASGGIIDVKATALAPLVRCARVVSLATDPTSISTRDRLSTAYQHGVISENVWSESVFALNYLTRLRIGAQLQQIRHRHPTSDHIVKRTLLAHDREHLRRALHAVRSLQHVVSTDFAGHI